MCYWQAEAQQTMVSNTSERGVKALLNVGVEALLNVRVSFSSPRGSVTPDGLPLMSLAYVPKKLASVYSPSSPPPEKTLPRNSSTVANGGRPMKMNARKPVCRTELCSYLHQNCRYLTPSQIQP